MKLTPREAWTVSRVLCGRPTLYPGMEQAAEPSDRIRALVRTLTWTLSLDDAD